MNRWNPLVVVLPLAGCLGSGDAPGEGDFIGGAVTIPACGYTITTRDGATAPVPALPRLGSSPTPHGVHLSIPSSDAATTIAVIWQTGDTDTLATTVEYGEGTTDQTVDGYTFEYQLGPPDTRSAVRIHETHLCGLKPNTLYRYRVGGKDASGEAWSPVSTFHTAPPKGTANPITIGLIGDSRGDYTKWGAMINALMAAATPDVIFFSGDAVTLGPLQTEWDQYFAQAESVLSKVAMVYAHGNHEVNSVNYYSQLALPRDEANYGIDYGPVHLTVLNDTALNLSDFMTTGTAFLTADLSANDSAAWKFLMHHKPMYSSASAHGSDLAIRGAWLPAVDAHRVDMVLNGHDHDYERSRPLRNDVVQTNPYDGTTFVVAGSAGAELYTSGMSSWTALAKSTYNFAVIKISGKTIDFRAYDDMGTVIDTLNYTKP